MHAGDYVHAWAYISFCLCVQTFVTFVRISTSLVMVKERNMADCQSTLLCLRDMPTCSKHNWRTQKQQYWSVSLYSSLVYSRDNYIEGENHFCVSSTGNVTLEFKRFSLHFPCGDKKYFELLGDRVKV